MRNLKNCTELPKNGRLSFFTRVDPGSQINGYPARARRTRSRWPSNITRLRISSNMAPWHTVIGLWAVRSASRLHLPAHRDIKNPADLVGKEEEGEEEEAEEERREEEEEAVNPIRGPNGEQTFSRGGVSSITPRRTRLTHGAPGRM